MRLFNYLVNATRGLIKSYTHNHIYEEKTTISGLDFRNNNSWKLSCTETDILYALDVPVRSK